jgi:hypothetical protein
MRKASLLLLVAALAAPITAVAAQSARDSVDGPAATATAQTAAACKPGLKTIKGVKVYVYCGRAKAAATWRGTRVAFTNGACVRATTGTWALNVGTATLPPKAPRYRYFGITIGKLRRAGQYKTAAVGFQWRGKTYGVTGVVTIKGKLVGKTFTVTTGTFKGKFEHDPSRTVTGSFSC